MPSFDHNIEDISDGTGSRPVLSQFTWMGTSRLRSGDRFRSNSIIARGDSPDSSSVANRRVLNVRMGTHSCGYRGMWALFARLLKLYSSFASAYCGRAVHLFGLLNDCISASCQAKRLVQGEFKDRKVSTGNLQLRYVEVTSEIFRICNIIY